MFDRAFFRTPLGRAAIASTAAMIVFVVLATPFAAPVGTGTGAGSTALPIAAMLVELA